MIKPTFKSVEPYEDKSLYLAWSPENGNVPEFLPNFTDYEPSDFSPGTTFQELGYTEDTLSDVLNDMLIAAMQDYWRANMEINYENLTDNELGEMYQLCAMELEKRKAQKQSEEWKKIIESLREYTKKYGINIDGTTLAYHPIDDGCDYIPAIHDDEFDEMFYNYGPGVIKVE